MLNAFVSGCEHVLGCAEPPHRARSLKCAATIIEFTHLAHRLIKVGFMWCWFNDGNG